MESPQYADDAAWLVERLRVMARTLKDNRNAVGTWNADVLDRTTYSAPETSGSVFFVYMIAGLINDGLLGPEYIPVVQKAWHFLSLSVTESGDLMRVQPTGRGPITNDFENHSETFGVGGFLLAAVEMSKLPQKALDDAAEVECLPLDLKDLQNNNGRIELSIEDLRRQKSDFPKNPSGKVQAVAQGLSLLPTTVDEANGKIFIDRVPNDVQNIYLFYQP